MNGVCALHVELFHTINGLTDDIQHAALNLIASRHLYGRTHWHSLQPSLQAVGVVHGHAAHGVLANVLLNLDNKFTALPTVNAQCLMNLRQHLLSIQSLCVEIDINHRTNDLADASFNL